MNFDPDKPSTWPILRPLIMAHDVGRSRDRSTAVVGGNSPVQPDLLGIRELEELPQGLFGRARASALMAVDRRYDCNTLIVADVSNDASYAEVLVEIFGRRVIGLHITRHGDGMQAEHRPVKGGWITVYNVGRSYLLELFHAQLQADLVRFVDSPMIRRAAQQLETLQMELKDSGTVYRCPPGQHDDLGISCAMLAWAARHPHLDTWIGNALQARRPRKRRETPSWEAWT